MIYAAWKLGTEGKDYKQEWQNKASSGTVAHCLAHGETFNPAEFTPEMLEKGNIAYQNYLKWLTMSQLTVEASEISLVCECYQFGGTIDDVWALDGERYIGDIKTGKLYYSHLVQVAAYKHLWECNFPDKPITGFHLLHFDKENADFGHNYYTNLDTAWEAFLHFRALYDLTSELEKRI